jgi:hypothetical protein
MRGNVLIAQRQKNCKKKKKSKQKNQISLKENVYKFFTKIYKLWKLLIPLSLQCIVSQEASEKKKKEMINTWRKHVIIEI